MINPLAIIGLAACLTSAPATVPKQPRPVPHHGGGTVIVKLIDITTTTQTTDSNTNESIAKDNIKIEDNQTNEQSSAESKFEAHKAILNERFANMFNLKKELDANNSYTSEKWNEYYLLHQSYEHQLKKIIADWVTDMQYEG